MAIKIDPRWTELQSRGYNLRDKDGDAAVELYFKGAYITDFNQTTVSMDEVIKEAEEHWQEITKDMSPKYCRHCTEWRSTYAPKGNCNKHPWEHDRYSQDASANGCEDYVDKYKQYEGFQCLDKVRR
jgi:hypothetical protein